MIDLNSFLLTIYYFLAAVIVLTVCMWIFEGVTKYRTWEGIKNGNMAVALATGGKIFGIANILRFAMVTNDSLWGAVIWGAIGFVLLLIAYFIFEMLTPKFNVDEEISKDNRAVGLTSLLISVGLSYVIGASIT